MRIKKAIIYNSKFLPPREVTTVPCFAVVIEHDGMELTPENIQKYQFRVSQIMRNELEGQVINLD